MQVRKCKLCNNYKNTAIPFYGFLVPYKLNETKHS